MVEQAGGEKRRRPLLMLLLVFLAVLLPFLAWYGSWFGRPMTDQEITAALQPDAGPRDVQHALTAVQARLAAGMESAGQWRALVIAHAKDPEAAVRRMVAWTIGHDRDPACHEALKGLLADEDLATRRNAAVALSKWRDPAGRQILLDILEPTEVRAPEAGVLDLKVAVDDAVTTGRDMAVIERPDDGAVSLRPPMNGRVLKLERKDDDRLAAGDLICVLSPDPESVYAALQALFLVGRKIDADAVAPYAEGAMRHMNDRIHQQARLTLDHLRRAK